MGEYKHQNVENQRFELANFAQKQGLPVDRWVEEQISSQKELKERKFGKLLGRLKKGDIVIATEISRLGRNLLEIMLILSVCIKKQCQIFSIKENYKLGFDIMSKVLAFVFGFSAEIERSLISARTRESLARAKAEEKKLGRPKDSGRVQGLRKEILRELKRGVGAGLKLSQARKRAAEKFNVSLASVYRVSLQPFTHVR